jgi:hypothetical protein
MKWTLVRYKAKPDAAGENQRLIETVFGELRSKSLEGVRYLVLKLADHSFVHFSATEDGAAPISRLQTFRAFQSGIKERCMEPPQSNEVTIVGNYRMLPDQRRAVEGVADP